MSYNVTKWLIVILFPLYVLLGVWGDSQPGDEVYPVFSWRLFDHIPNIQSDYTVRIYQYGETTPDTPVWFADSSGVFSSLDLSPPGYVLLFRALGRAIEEQKSPEAVSRARAQLEKHFSVTPVVYELVRIIYNPIDYWKDRSITSLISVGKFTAGGVKQ